MKTSTISSYVALSLLTLSSLAWTQRAGAEPKIGIVNFKQLLEAAPDTKTAMDASRVEFEQRRRELLKMQSEAKAHPGNEQLQRDQSERSANAVGGKASVPTNIVAARRL
jgi:Skp family chaperone for outer membrane proteins